MKKLKDSLKIALASNCCHNISQFQTACYNELFPKIYKIAYSYFPTKAEDITQDIFLKIFQLDIAKLERHLDYIDKYLLKIAQNYCRTLYKKKKPLTDGEEMLLVVQSKGVNIDQQIDFEKCIQSIPERQAFALSQKMKGYAIKEIASSMDISEGAAKNLIYNGKRNIKKYFSSQ